MVLTPLRDPLHSLQEAITTGAVVLIDENAHPLTLDASFRTRCWAHLRDAQDGRVYVQELAGSQELLQPRYQALFVESV